MSNIVAFITARLDDDEQVAHAAMDGQGWQTGKPWSGIWTADTDGWPGMVEDATGGIVVHDEGSPNAEQAQHIARHDPARVLREVAAKRRLLSLDVGADEYNNDVVRGYYDCHSDVLRLLAQPYADHPDYDPSWSPT